MNKTHNNSPIIEIRKTTLSAGVIEIMRQMEKETGKKKLPVREIVRRMHKLYPEANEISIRASFVGLLKKEVLHRPEKGIYEIVRNVEITPPQPNIRAQAMAELENERRERERGADTETDATADTDTRKMKI